MLIRTGEVSGTRKLYRLRGASSNIAGEHHIQNKGRRSLLEYLEARDNNKIMGGDKTFGEDDFRALAEFRYQVRHFLRFSEGAAREAGLEPQHYLMMLAIKGLPAGMRSRVGELAERMQLQHHSTVELVDRLARQKLVQRQRSSDDRREVLVTLTEKGEKLVRQLAMAHKQHLQSEGPKLLKVLRTVVTGQPTKA